MAEFMWYDLMTTDMAAAAEFYHAVTGVTALPPEGGMDYRVLTVANAGIGGMMPISPEKAAAGMRPCWMGYVGVEDVDAEAARLEAEGGRLHRPPETVPGIVRFAVVSDPQGTNFMLLRGLSTEPFQRPPKHTPGTVSWHELHAKDGSTALDFYTRMFGWQKVADHDMGSMGVYRLFNAGSGDAVGGLMTKMDPSPVPYWLFYTQVDAIDAAAERVKAHGGQILNGPMEVPGGDWVAQCLDPQGAMFALVGPKV
jgi:predicted enzyme related to lactoylglutathione lyase